MQPKQYCPICNNETEYNQRHPNYVCRSCNKNPVDENGRGLLFSNIDLSGGFEAKYADTKEVSENHIAYGHICYIQGVECWATEYRFGGIVIEPMDEERRAIINRIKGKK
ncbi:hypothetical protein [Psychromonas algicola]|uniref:hypothetical protein n=1 Tax=Psychromonas algicola TaxID=2555642 RepID=UPI001067ACBD|nr:hypothetical protein [Psychromonas sp. RZ5]TEW51235.1 hypothetical protein E2R67_08430 [Psychromonas sp. RZ5]